MKTTYLNRTLYFRFKRWNRGHYSAFVSIGKTVTIGCVCSGIIDMSLQKQHIKTLIPLFCFYMFADTLLVQQTQSFSTLSCFSVNVIIPIKHVEIVSRQSDRLYCYSTIIKKYSFKFYRLPLVLLVKKEQEVNYVLFNHFIL